jgi:hypothetical protein
MVPCHLRLAKQSQILVLPSETRYLTPLQGALRIQNAIELNELGNQSRPTGLMAGTQPCAVVTVKVFEELHVIPPMRIGLKLSPKYK